MTQRTPSQEWMRSARLAARIVRPGPQVSPAKAYDVVEGLRAAGHRAAELVPELAGLPAPTGLLSHVSVVDRRGWTITAARSMDHLLGLSTAHAVEGKPDPTDVTSGVEVMATLTFLSQRILGQFDPFGPSLATSPPPLIRQLLTLSPPTLRHRPHRVRHQEILSLLPPMFLPLNGPWSSTLTTSHCGSPSTNKPTHFSSTTHRGLPPT